jgi:pathogenesis-related protein 1
MRATPSVFAARPAVFVARVALVALVAQVWSGPVSAADAPKAAVRKVKRPAAAAAAAAAVQAAGTSVPAGGNAAAAPGQTGEVAAADATALVAAHNALRAEVGQAPLVWDAVVARTSAAHAVTLSGPCALAHGNASTGYGENLASFSGNGSLTTAVSLWGSEKPKYAGAGGPYQGPADGAGHYTQVIWGATKKVGCGQVTCSNNLGNQTIVVCRYDPQGNVLGQRVY